MDKLLIAFIFMLLFYEAVIIINPWFYRSKSKIIKAIILAFDTIYLLTLLLSFYLKAEIVIFGILLIFCLSFLRIYIISIKKHNDKYESFDGMLSFTILSLIIVLIT